MSVDPLDKAQKVRRAILGDAYVDAQAAEAPPALRDFQDHLTRQAWGAWAREGVLSFRDRSLLVLAMTAAMGRMEEFKLHARAQPRTGVTNEELDEMVFMVAGYCGGPAALSVIRALRDIRQGSEEG
jgi:4-carboxymuconolactone decarboxylase